MSERQIIAVGGDEIETIVMGHGPETVVFFHGYPDTCATFARLFEAFEALPARGVRFVSVPLPGYQGSEVGAALRLDELTRRIVARIEAVSQGPTTLVGHDWGAVAAWCVAAHAPEAVQGVVAMSVPPLMNYIVEGLKSPRQIVRSRYVYRYQLPWLPEWQIRQRSQVEGLWRSWFGPGELPSDHVATVAAALAQRPSAALAYYRGLRALAWSSSLREFIGARPQIPVLGIYGEADPCVGAELWADTASWGDDVLVEGLAGVGHFPQWEAPEKVAELIWAFAQNVSATYNNVKCSPTTVGLP